MVDIKWVYERFLAGYSSIKIVDKSRFNKLIEKNKSRQNIPLEGTDIDSGLYLLKEYDGSYTSLKYNVSRRDHVAKNFISEALAVGYLYEADNAQLSTLDNLFREIKENHPFVFKKLEEALLSPIPANEKDSLEIMADYHTGALYYSLRDGKGLYNPVYGVYIRPLANSTFNERCIAFYILPLEAIKIGIEHGAKRFEDISEHNLIVAKIPIHDSDDTAFVDIAETIGVDGRWCVVTKLDDAELEWLIEITERNRQIVKNHID